MSKNYELLQQAEFDLGGATGFAPREEAAPKETYASPLEQVVNASDAAVSEEVSKLVQNLFLASGENSPKMVLFAAIDSNAGCTALCSMAARLLAESVTKSVCVVEGNLRVPSLADAMGVGVEYGLVDSLHAGGSIRDFAHQVGPHNLWLLAGGSRIQDSAVLLNSPRVAERLQELRNEFDYVVMNAPPLNIFADGLALGRLADGVVLVLEADATRREAAVRVTENLRATNIPVLGAVLNNRTFPIPSAVYTRL
jgi:protein-tyrosine kinase